jgi:hypothetical protein
MMKILEVLARPLRLNLRVATAIFAAQAIMQVATALPSQSPGAVSLGDSVVSHASVPVWVKAENDRHTMARTTVSSSRDSTTNAALRLVDEPPLSSEAHEERQEREFVAPQGIAVDARGDLYVTDTAQQKVFKVTRDGQRRTIGSGFMVPQAVAVDAGGNVYVADSQAGVIYKISPSGAQSTVGSGFYMPMGLALDAAGNLYAADPWNDFVAKITPDGNQTNIGSGYGSPVGVAVDSAGNVYVGDTYNSSVYMVSPIGTQTLVSNLVAPMYVAVDSNGELLVTDAGTGSLTAIGLGGVETTIKTHLDVPMGLAADPTGGVYVVASFAQKIVKVTR